jgi:hypothetical protein
MEPADSAQDAEFDAAARSCVQRLKKGPVAVAVRYNKLSGRVGTEHNSGLEIGCKPQYAQRHEAATPADLGEIEISPFDQVLHYPAIDADLHLQDLLGVVPDSEKIVDFPEATPRPSTRTAALAGYPGTGAAGFEHGHAAGTWLDLDQDPA